MYTVYNYKYNSPNNYSNSGAIILCQIARVPMECVPDYSQDALAIIDRTKDREMREYKHQDPYIFSLRLAFWKIVDQS